MAVRICDIAHCGYDAAGIVGTVRDLPERETDEITLVSLHVCEGHREMLKGKRSPYAVDATNVLIERPHRKPADWCRFCDGPCKVGHPGSERFHEEVGA